MPTEVIVALVGGVLGGGGIVGAVLAFLTNRQRNRIDEFGTKAEAQLKSAQANDLLFENLTAAYKAATDELAELRAEVRSLPALRAEVAELRQQVAQFEAVVMTLPDEYRGRFADVLRKGTRPKADVGGSGT